MAWLLALLFLLTSTDGIAKNWSKLTLTKQSCWEAELNEALKGVDLKPIPSLRKDRRCDVRPIKEKLFHKISRSYLKKKNEETSSNLLRLSRGLQCISRTELDRLDERLAHYVEKLTKSEEPSCKKGLAGITNAAILVIDLFPNARESELQQQFQLNKSTMLSALESNPNEAGLWCSDHLGSVHQYQTSCSGKSGRGKTSTCINPLAQMIRTYADENSALGIGRCRCTQMIENNFLCNEELPPCLKEMFQSSRESPTMGGSGSPRKLSSQEKTLVNKGPSTPSRGDHLASLLGEFSESELRTMGCNQRRMRDFMGGISGIAASGRCDMRTMIGLGQALAGSNRQKSFQEEMRCYTEAFQRDRERQYEVRESSQAFMDPNCAASDGNGDKPNDPPPPPPPQPTRPATAEERRANATAAQQAASRLTNPNTTDGHNLLVLAGGNQQQADAAVAQAQRAGANARVSDDLSDNTPQAQTGGTVTRPTINVDADLVGDSRVMAHEMMHAAAETLTRGAITNEQVHEIMSNHLRDAGRHTPCPDCPDTCSVQDELVNDIMDCFEGAEQAREQEMLENSCNNPNNPIQCESQPDPNAPPETDPLLEAAFDACLGSGQSQDKTDYNGSAGATDSCMYDGDPSCPQAGMGQVITDFNGDAGATDTCMNPDDPTCNNSPCPLGEELVIGLRGMRCEPVQGVGNPSGPGPQPDPAMMYQYQNIQIMTDQESGSDFNFNYPGSDEDDSDSGDNEGGTSL